MSLNLDISPQAEARFTEAAQQNGIDPSTFFEKMLNEYLPGLDKGSVTAVSAVISAKNTAAIAYLTKRIEEERTDNPEEVRQANAEIEELLNNLNKNRVESGERTLFP
jgi:hypothetical protein